MMSLIAASCASIFPPALESCRCQLGIANRVLNVFVPQVRLQRSRIPPRIRLVETAGVPEHVWVSLDLELGGLASPVDKLLEVADRHRRAALGQEQERRLAFGLTMQFAQCPQLPAGQRVS